MMPLAASALCIAAAAVAVYVLCRHLSCARLPAVFGASAWAFSEALLWPAREPSHGFAGPSVLVPFALAGVFSRERRRWPFLALAVVGITLRWRPGAGAAPVASGELEALVLAVLAGLGAQRLWDGEGGAAFLVGAAAAVIGTMARHAEADTLVLLIEGLPAAAALGLVALMSRQARARAGLVALVALFAVQRSLEIGVGAAGRLALATAAKTSLPRP